MDRPKDVGREIRCSGLADEGSLVDGDMDDLSHVRVSQIMNAEVLRLEPQILVEQAREALVAEGARVAVVVDPGYRPMGVVTLDGLLLGEARARSGRQSLADIMTRAVRLPETASIARAAGLMYWKGVTEVVVTDVHGHVAGLLSALDIARHVAERTGYVPAVSLDEDLREDLPAPVPYDVNPAVVTEMHAKPILVVDDDPAVCDGLVDLLEEEGYRAIQALDGRQALELLRHLPTPPGLILLDLMMPRMDGWEFRQRQLCDARLRPIPVVVLTAHGRLQQWDELRSPAAVLAKPIGVQTLLDVVHEHYQEPN